MFASSAACEIRNAEANLNKKVEDLESKSHQLELQQRRCRDISAKRADELDEVRAESLKMEELQCKGQQLELGLQRAESKLHTQDRHYKQERQEWQSKLRQLQLAEHSQHSQRSSILSDQSQIEVKGPSEETEMLSFEKARLEKEAQDMKQELVSAKNRHSLHLQEAQALLQQEEKRKEMLLNEIRLAKSHITAMAQELDRLQEATENGNHSEKAAALGKAMPGSEAPYAKPRGPRTSRAEQTRIKNIQKLLAQEEKQEALLQEQIDTSQATDT